MLDLSDCCEDESFKIMNTVDINPIISNYGLTYDEQNAIVHIGDIIGHNSFENSYLSDSLDKLFDERGDGYHTRSLGMLEYSSDEIMDKFASSFVSEPIKLCEVENCKYLVSSNGLHRWTVLRYHYLSELNKGATGLSKKYNIPVVYTKVNLNKTYCNYLLHILSGYQVWNDFDEHYKMTDNVVVIFSDKRYKIYEDELILLTKEVFLNSLDEKNINFDEIIYFYNNIESFRNFINNSLCLEKKMSEGGRVK